MMLQGFGRQSSVLLKILSSVRNHQINSDLAKLLLRLDYNKYYTQAGGTLSRYDIVTRGEHNKNQDLVMTLKGNNF